MIIKFQLGDYEDICDEYEECFENEETFDVADGDNLLVVRSRRIVVPELHVSFREADWYIADDPDDDDALECQGSVLLQYDENEKDPEKFISYATCDLAYFAGDLLGEKGKDYDAVSRLDCYIDISEFSEEE